MELRHLRYFVAAAEELHFRRAAERLGIAQPALSQQIQQLEQEIEALLFHRLTRGVELADAGRVFLDDARAILEHVEQAKAKAQRVARGDQGMIRIGFTGSASFNPIVPGVIQDYRARFPGIAVSLVESGTSQLVDSLRAGRVDAAFIRSPSREVDGLLVVSILEEEMLIALPSRHDLAASASLPLEALSGEPFILFPRANKSGTLRQHPSGMPTRWLQPEDCPAGPRGRLGSELDRGRGGRLDRPCLDAAHAAARGRLSSYPRRRASGAVEPGTSQQRAIRGGAQSRCAGAARRRNHRSRHARPGRLGFSEHREEKEIGRISAHIGPRAGSADRA